MSDKKEHIDSDSISDEACERIYEAVQQWAESRVRSGVDYEPGLPYLFDDGDKEVVIPLMRAAYQKGQDRVLLLPLRAWKDAVLDALAAWPGMDFKVGTDPALILAAILRIEREAAADPRLHAPAVADVLAERQRQVDLGWTPEHDDGLVNDEIAAFACYYLMPEGARDWDTSSTGYGATLGEAIQPKGFFAAPGSSRRRDLVKAVALGIAEIERLDRAEAAAAAAKGGAV